MCKQPLPILLPCCGSGMDGRDGKRLLAGEAA